MEAINSIFVVSAKFAPILAQLSIVIFCCLLGFIFLRPVLANRRRSNVQQWNLQAREVNDSLYELHKPTCDPTIQVLFFHGLPFGESAEAHLSTWISGDGSCIWPKDWLAEEFPDAHILFVSYIEGLRKGSAETFDMRIISENLTSDLMQANIGQTPHCPVVLVGHSFGGLVIKELCRHAHSMNAAKVKKFLDSLRGVFYYSTPHHGSSDIGRARSVLSSPLFDYFTTLSKLTSRLNSDFQSLRTCYPNWEIEGLGEGLPVNTGIFRGVVVVPEASARDGVNFNLDSSADHFSVCRPDKKTSRRFNALTTLLRSVCDHSKEEKAVAGRQAIRQDWEYLPKQLVNMDVLVQEVKSRLQNSTALGLVGMGGLGKTTLAKAVFNELSPAYEYSCFVPDLKVKVKGGDIEEVKKVVWKHMHHLGRKVQDTEDWSALFEKQLLFVLDNVTDDVEITLLSHLVYRPSPESRFIVTSRNKDILNGVPEIDIYEVPFLDQKNSEKLFLGHAFPKPTNLPPNLERDMQAIVENCSGLPLTLEVLGNLLKFKQDGMFWQQTLQALIKAENIRDLDKRLWAKLRVSYDALEEVEQQMFLDATTFFRWDSWSVFDAELGWSKPLYLRDAKAAWRKAYGTEYETIQWQTLVDRCLVYHVEEDESIEVHDQLLSLGRKIASEPSTSGRCRVWDKKTASKLLQDNGELANQDIHALRLSNDWDASSSDEIHISSRTLHKLKKLQYLEANGPLFIDGVEEESSFPSKLVLLKCVGRLDAFNFALQDRLVVLHLQGVRVLPRSIGQLSALRIFIGLGLESIPDEFGNLSQLEHLEFEKCYQNSLPETFYKLLQLQYLKFRDCSFLRMLPEKFGALSKLKDLQFERCEHLRSLPDTFGDLSALDRLVLDDCPRLKSLPNSFGTLSALTHLEISSCHKLRALPESLGNLSALEHLKITTCSRLKALPNSFGHLSALSHLEISSHDRLRALPELFGNLSALKHLEIICCDQLQVLPDSFGHLSALKHLEISGCRDLRAPDSFGNLQALQDLKLEGRQLESVLNSVGKLSRLRRLQLTDSSPNMLSVIPFGELSQLQNLEISGSCDIIPIKKLPESLAELRALTHLVLSRLSIRSIPDFLKSMQSLRTLELSVLPYVKEVPTWLGDAGAAPLAWSRKIFQVHDNRFSLTREESEIAWPSGASTAMRWMLITSIHRNAMEKASEYDYEGALADMSPANLEVVGPRCQRFLLKERGIVRCQAGDLQGALADLTTALEVLSDDAESDDAACEVSFDDAESAEDRDLRYDCRRYRGYVNFLLGDMSRAKQDGAKALKILRRRRYYVHRHFFGPVTMEEPVTYMDFRLERASQVYWQDEKLKSVLSQVMEKVTISDIQGALAIWCDFDGRGWGYYDRVYFLQERGILKRMAGELHGALEDLTAALEIEDDDYEVLKHRGYVKYLMGDDAGARKDGDRCMAMDPVVDGPDCLGGLPVAFLEFRLKGREQLVDNLGSISHGKVMNKVKEKEFIGALAIWDDFDTRVYGYLDRVSFLQERGILKRMAGDLHGALEDLTAALEIEDDDYEVLKHRGYVKHLMGDDAGARKDGDRCMAMDPVVDGPDCLGGLPVAFLEFRLKGRNECEKNLWSLSHEKFMEKVEEDDFVGALAIWDGFGTSVCSDNYRAFFLQERGILKRMAGDFHGALEDLTAALEIEDDAYELLKHRGYVKHLMGDNAGARKDADRCMAMDAVVDGPDCLGGLPVVFLEFRLNGRNECEENLWSLSHEKFMEKVEEEDFVGALAIWDGFGTSVCSDNYRVLFLQERGILKRMARDLHGALEDLTAALDIEDDAYELLKHRGYVKHLMGDNAGARKDADRCMAMDPVVDGPDCLAGLPVVFLEFRLNGRNECEENLWSISHEKFMEKVEEEDFVGALAIWDGFGTSLCSDKYWVVFLQERGILKQIAGDLHGALEDLTAALEIEDDYYELLKDRGYVKHLMGDTAGARKDADTCMGMHPLVNRPDCLEELPLEFRLKEKYEREENLWSISHEKFMEKVEEEDFVGALAIWDSFGTSVCSDNYRVLFLQERGILKRMAGELHGALEDLTAALDITGDNYECLKHRGYVKFLLEDIDGARKDAERYMAMDPVVYGPNCLGGLGGLPVAFLEFRLKGREVAVDKLMRFFHDKVMKKVDEKEFVGALAVWDNFHARVGGYCDRVIFFQERGILKRMAGDLHGALEDLTAALEMGGDDYECLKHRGLKHRGYVKFLLGDTEGARKDAERCLALGLKEPYGCLRAFRVAFLEFEL